MPLDGRISQDARNLFEDIKRMKTLFTHGSSSEQSTTLSPEERDKQGLEQWRKEQRMLFSKHPKCYDQSTSASAGGTSHLPSHVLTKVTGEESTPDATCVSQVSELPTESTRDKATGHGGVPTRDFGHQRSVAGVYPVRCTDTIHASAASTSKPS